MRQFLSHRERPGSPTLRMPGDAGKTKRWTRAPLQIGRIMRKINIIAVLFLFLAAAVPAHAGPSHALAISGHPKYPPDFTHFDYVDPDAPKGGDVTLEGTGTYDSFNPFIVKGVSADGLGLVLDTLTVKSDDEPFTEYGLVADTMELAPDRTWVVFHIDPRARFHDGRKMTASDVVFTFETLMDKGGPTYKNYYGDVAKAEALDGSRVKFSFKSGENPELPLILGQLPVLPEHWWKGRDFSHPSLEPPLGSGPYRVGEFQAGRSVTYERVPDYWAADLPVNKGRYNFGSVTYDYYRDNTVSLQAFTSGEYDYRREMSSKDWATSYTGPPFEAGVIKTEVIPNELPQGMQGFVMNTRRELFRDPRVRQALSLAFDFEWSNETLFHGQYKRTKSFFSNSELSSRAAPGGLPSKDELALLEPFRDRLPPEVFTTVYEPPSTKGPGGIRANLRQALDLLRRAGWEVRDGVLTQTSTGRLMEFEILYYSQAFERVLGPYARNLARLGVKVDLRMVDASQYVNRITNFDFDMTVHVWGQSLSPGNEQRYFWSSAAADMPGSQNLPGIKDPVVDALVETLVTARGRENLVTVCRALDRVLLWGHYVVPNWHLGAWRIAWWDKFGRPEVQAPYDTGLYNWWVDPAKAAVVDTYKRGTSD